MQGKNVNNLLYVDDEPSNLEIFKISFRRHFNVFTAESGIEAIEILRTNDINLLVTDQLMPGMTGTELLGKIKDEFPDLIKIILTGYTDQKTLIEAINVHGIFQYITKPYDFETLKSVLERGFENFNKDLVLRREITELKVTNESLWSEMQRLKSKLDIA